MKKDRKQKQYIFICHGKDCLKSGTKEIQNGLEKELKGRGIRCEFIKTRCMDHCKDGPCVIIDDVWYGRVKPKDFQNILLNKKAVN